MAFRRTITLCQSAKPWQVYRRRALRNRSYKSSSTYWRTRHGGTLSGFPLEKWSKLNEALFTKRTKNLASLSTEFATVGVDRDLLDLTKTWANGVTEAKLFCKEYVMYTKTRYKHVRFFVLRNF